MRQWRFLAICGLVAGVGLPVAAFAQTQSLPVIRPNPNTTPTNPGTFRQLLQTPGQSATPATPGNGNAGFQRQLLQQNNFTPVNPAFQQLSPGFGVTRVDQFGRAFVDFTPGFGGVNRGAVTFGTAFNGANAGTFGFDPFFNGGGFNGFTPTFQTFNPGFAAFNPFFGGVWNYTPNTGPISAAGTPPVQPAVHPSARAATAGGNTPVPVSEPAAEGAPITQNAVAYATHLNRVAMRLQAIMRREPVVEGTVMRVTARNILVRIEDQGQQVTRAYSPMEVFYFNGQDLFDAQTSPVILTQGMKVLVPQRSVTRA